MILNGDNGLKILVRLLLLTFAVVLSGCTFNHVSELRPSLDNSTVTEKLPLAVGVYYSPQFRDYEQARWKWFHRWIVPVGNASVTLFDKAFPMLFDDVVPVEGIPTPAKRSDKVVTIIEPSIEEFDFDLPLALGDYTADITYRITLRNSDGTGFASWTVEGHGKQGVGLGYLTHATPIGQVTDAAMEEAMRKFVEGFREVPEVRAWLRQSGLLRTE